MNCLRGSVITNDYLLTRSRKIMSERIDADKRDVPNMVLDTFVCLTPRDETGVCKKGRYKFGGKNKSSHSDHPSYIT